MMIANMISSMQRKIQKEHTLKPKEVKISSLRTKMINRTPDYYCTEFVKLKNMCITHVT